MIRRSALSAVLVLVTGASACATAGIGSAMNAQADEQAIREADRQWVAAVAARDLDRTVGVDAPNALFMAPNAPQAAGTAAIRSAWAGLFQLPNLSLSFAPTSIRVSRDGTMAYDVGTYSFGFDGPQGRVNDRGKYLVVWEKVNGQWKVAADMFNSDLPAGR